jgi:SCY1-like protein 1
LGHWLCLTKISNKEDCCFVAGDEKSIFNFNCSVVVLSHERLAAVVVYFPYSTLLYSTPTLTMGNSASSLPYSIGEKASDDGCWAVHDGSQKSDGAPVTVFQASKPALAKEGYRGGSGHEKKIFVAHHHFVHAKKLRHPYILQVLATLDTDAPDSGASVSATTSASPANMATTGAYIIVTEPCIPLTEWLSSLPKKSQDQLAWGLQCMVQALTFVHTSGQVAHGNISPQAFYVTPSGDIKLWNFSLVTPIGVADGGGGPSHHFRQYEGMLTPQSYRSPERVKGQYEALATSPIHCMDAYSLGVLINEYYEGRIPQPLQKAVQRLQTPSLKMRPRLGPLLRCPIFETPYAKLLQELTELHIQAVDYKLRFWQSLEMDDMDPSVAQFKVLPLIQSTIKTICASEAMLSQDLYRREVLSMLTPLFYIAENFLSKEVVGHELTPLVQLLFSVKDRGVRGALLGKTPLFAQHLSKQDLNTLVFEPLCSGFADSSDALRELTLKATVVMVPHLYPPNVEKLSRYLVRLQSDTSPSIRAHTMSMIPQLAPHLSEVARHKLLLPAFGRAFKDPHPPCRLASLQCTATCQEYFTLEELATKVLPAVMPLVLDGVGDVRNAAFSVIDTFLSKIKAQHDERSIGEVSSVAAIVHTTQQHHQVPPAAPSSGLYLGGISSWYSTSGAPDPVAAPAPKMPSQERQRNTSTMQPPSKPTPTFSSLNIGGDTLEDDSGGWDDDDDDLDLGGKEEDVFASIGMNSSSKGRSSGKLIMGNKGGAGKKKAEVQKLSMDDELDGWDDF